MNLRLTFLASGSNTFPEFVIRRGGSFSNLHLPASVAIIDHPQEGIILFDTGYSEHFFEATKDFPERFYSMASPVTLVKGQSAVEQLKMKGIQPHDVKWIICSHFHADHISGLKDFPRAKFVFHADEYRSFVHRGRIDGLLHGYLQALLPHDLRERAIMLEPSSFIQANHDLAPFDYSFDLFGDGSMILVHLPGHTAGQIGALVRSSSEDHFLVGDAAWSSPSIEKNIPPNALGFIIMDQKKVYLSTLQKLHDLNNRCLKGLTIVPCHCGKVHLTHPFL